MSDRTVYYMDGDWPQNAPANYVPIREGGGRTRNGSGATVGEIELGGRLIRAIAIPPHTPGSTAYLDTDNRMLISGDALGSGWPWLHWALIADYAAALDHVAAIAATIPGIAVLPAHFYQVEAYGRRDGPPGYQYILDQQASAHGIISGAIEGEPYFLIDPTVYWAGTRSARLTYSLARVDAADGKPVTNYRAVRIPGVAWRREWVRDARQQKLFDIHSDFHLIRSASGNVIYLLKGSRSALLIGTGSGEPGLAELVKRLIDNTSLHVVTLTNQPSQTGGLKLLSPSRHVELREGLTFDLGPDAAGRPVQVEAHAAGNTFTLLSVSDRMLFAAAHDAIRSAPANWRTATQGRYDLVYTASSDKWFTSPDELNTER
jgi:hypothetical protein